MTRALDWAKAFPYVERPGEDLLSKCARINDEITYCIEHGHRAPARDFTEPKKDEES